VTPSSILTVWLRYLQYRIIVYKFTELEVEAGRQT